MNDLAVGSPAPQDRPVPSPPSPLWWLALPAVLLIFLLLALRGLDQESITMDEGGWLYAGTVLVDSFKFDESVTVQHPPLTFYVHGLLNKAVGWLALLPRDQDARLYWSRFAMLIFPFICIVVLFLWTRELFGPLPAALASLLLALNPNFIGHARLVTSDVPLAALSLAAV